MKKFSVWSLGIFFLVMSRAYALITCDLIIPPPDRVSIEVTKMIKFLKGEEPAVFYPSFAQAIGFTEAAARKNLMAECKSLLQEQGEKCPPEESPFYDPAICELAFENPENVRCMGTELPICVFQ